MSEENQKQTENKKPEVEQQALTEEQQLMYFFKEYGMPLVIGVVVAVLAFAGYAAYRNHKINQSVQAAAMLASAQNADQLQNVINRYAKTPSAPVAMLALAGEYLNNGSYPMARTMYTRFETEYPDHPMVGAAEVGKAYCAEGEGNVEEALRMFQAFTQNHPNHFLTPQAVFSQARCLEQLGRLDEARIMYEEFLTDNEDDRWAAQAETALLYVKKEIRAREKGIVPAAPAPVQMMQAPMSFQQQPFNASPFEQPQVQVEAKPAPVEVVAVEEVVEPVTEPVVEETAVVEEVITEEVADDETVPAADGDEAEPDEE
ncbi:MAG: tetratricopeptide repeat protein [Spartobacteria bacterium]|nr:tetratricopeptide repeat protein [Spartobacteria bacterium]